MAGLAGVIKDISELSPAEFDALVIFVAQKKLLASDARGEHLDPSTDEEGSDNTQKGIVLFLHPPEQLVTIANLQETNGLPDFKKPEFSSGAASAGKLKAMNCLWLLQYCIAHCDGVIGYKQFYALIGTWLASVSPSVTVAEKTLRGWMSKWKSEGYIYYVEGRRGTYTMTRPMLKEAMQRNLYLSNFPIKTKFPELDNSAE